MAASTKRRRRSNSRGRYWSAEVNDRSDALDLTHGIFRSDSPRQIALSLKRSAVASKRRKVLELAKGELRKAFYRA